MFCDCNIDELDHPLNPAKLRIVVMGKLEVSRPHLSPQWCADLEHAKCNKCVDIVVVSQNPWHHMKIINTEYCVSSEYDSVHMHVECCTVQCVTST